MAYSILSTLSGNLNKSTFKSLKAVFLSWLETQIIPEKPTLPPFRHCEAHE